MRNHERKFHTGKKLVKIAGKSGHRRSPISQAPLQNTRRISFRNSEDRPGSCRLEAGG
jgi:tRNA(Phe) wybutosine-synthesizing methylase Tyw3